MKEMQLLTTSSLRALLNTEPIFPIMDTAQHRRTELGEESSYNQLIAIKNMFL